VRVLSVNALDFLFLGLLLTVKRSGLECFPLLVHGHNGIAPEHRIGLVARHLHGYGLGYASGQEVAGSTTSQIMEEAPRYIGKIAGALPRFAKFADRFPFAVEHVIGNGDNAFLLDPACAFPTFDQVR